MFNWFKKKIKILSSQEANQLAPVYVTVEGLGETSWNSGKHLLETLESAGFPVRHSCRKGNCGACVAEIIQGEVAYLHNVTYETNSGEALLCAAVPLNNVHLKLNEKAIKQKK